ncbi:MAG: transcriptional repressor [Acidimicrobiia bacterium]|nr:transcriptional repressor [Acidimicrobiia bacterium]NNC76263.1 transcriptional repressor [Acidimicrobiia bacterium]
MHITADTLLNALRSQGMRITDARIQICEEIAERHGEHLTATAISETVDANESTVYRTLEVLEQAGIVEHSHMGHGPAVYHLAEDSDHHHLVCERCGRAEALPAAAYEALVAGITAETGFVPTSRHFALTGLCSRCKAENT